MPRPPQSPHRLDVDATTAPILRSFLEGLGLDERALTESPLAKHRSQVSMDLYPEERTALDDAASAIGAKRAGTRLARAIVRSWLINPWNHPPEFGEHDFGQGHQWATSLEAVRSTAVWTEAASEPPPVFATLIGRLDRADLLAVAIGVVGQLSQNDRETLLRAFSEGR